MNVLLRPQPAELATTASTREVANIDRSIPLRLDKLLSIASLHAVAPVADVAVFVRIGADREANAVRVVLAEVGDRSLNLARVVEV